MLQPGSYRSMRDRGSELIPRHRVRLRAGPSGIHIFDRHTGLNVLLDEVTVPSASWALAPRFVSLALTNACDLSCPYCYAPKNHAVLDPERVALWLGDLDKHGCLGVGFGGGEPTLYRPLVEVCRSAVQYTNLAVTLTTHAHRLDDRMIAALSGSVHFVRISMDGMGRTYERLRGRSFALLRQRLGEVRALCPFGINYVVNAQTLPGLDDATELAAAVGAAEFLLLPEQPTRTTAGVDQATLAAFRHWVHGYRGPVPLSVSEAGSDGLPKCDPTPGETGLRAYAHVSALGVLKRSSYEPKGVTIVNDSIIEALQELRIKYQDGQE